VKKTQRSDRGAALVLVLALVMVSSIFSAFWFFLASGEKDRTRGHAREIEASIIGEGAASRIAALVDQSPWSERFYVRLAQTGRPFLFTHKTVPFDMRHGGFASGDVSFAGTIYDHPKVPLTFRIVMEIEVRGSRVVMTWDKVYPQGLLSSSCTDGSLLSAQAEGSSSDRVDQLIDDIRNDSRGNRGEGELSDPGLAAEIDDRRSGQNPGRTLLAGGSSGLLPASGSSSQQTNGSAATGVTTQ